MSQAKKGELNFRCPDCFARDIDMDMFYDEEKQEYYCLRCGFVGKKEEVLRLNENIKHKYHFLKKRVVDFGEDNEPLVMKDHKRGEQ